MSLGSRLAGLLLAAVLWLVGRPAFAKYGLAEGLGLLSVIVAVVLGAYTLMASLRFVLLSRLEAREPSEQRGARWLAVLHLASALALLEESMRLNDGFWWKAALVPVAFILWIAVRLRWRIRRPRKTWRTFLAQRQRPSSWPDITVMATRSASALYSTSASVRASVRSSVSVDLGSMG